MLLVIDAGNTNITLGVYKSDELLFVSRLATDRTVTEDEFAIKINSIFKLNGIEPNEFSGAIISSVVPEISRSLIKGVKIVTGKEPVLIGPGVKTGLNIKIDNPSELGADLCATAVGALNRYELPLIIVDLGTATKISVLDENGAFLGVSIAPGMLLSLDALASGASQLSSIALRSPKKTIATNTTESIRVGMVYGTAEMIDGIIDRMTEEMDVPPKTIVATGGLCPAVIKHCRHSILVNKDLLMEGLCDIYKKNQ